MTAYDEGLAALREAQGPLPVRSRGIIALLEENCTACMVCARECPDWCIEIDSHKRGRPRVLHVLDRFAIDYSLCMWCGICVEACPFDALFWAPEVPDATREVQELVHERPQLRDWLAGVPAPPALDPAAEPAKEVQDAQKRARPGP
jgi:NADH-quinone oxidoreductase subunit I